MRLAPEQGQESGLLRSLLPRRFLLILVCTSFNVVRAIRQFPTKEFFYRLLIFVLAWLLGKGAVAGAAVVGLGALGYYGLGISSQTGTLEQSL